MDDFQIFLNAAQELELKILSQRLDVEQSQRWLDFVLKPKLLNWSQSNSSCFDDQDYVGSLQLVDLEKYNNLYKHLKNKHVETVMKMWTNAGESTDPLKFIHEDLAIAAYLICLWQNEENFNGSFQAFADLGCGNGLLVYILQQEGFHGYGYDIRARKLWSQFPSSTNLIEEPIDPLKFKLPSEVNWLIGNHSDELSPWLPVCAALAAYEMNYFLLPCCAYEFSGLKFHRRNTGISVYQDFMLYAGEISQKCGFDTLQDRLKIPSTKRKALLGISRSYSKSQHMQKVAEIQNFVQQQLQIYGSSEQQQIKLREKQEKVRNCTQIEASIINELVLKIFKLLLSSEDSQHSSWLAGKRLRMCDIVQYLSKEDLKHIKAECGGIKTLLRNKHEIFEFCGGDLIGIRKPIARKSLPADKLQTIKKRACFFQKYHPQGCPLSSVECTFVHE